MFENTSFASPSGVALQTQNCMAGPVHSLLTTSFSAHQRSHFKLHCAQQLCGDLQKMHISQPHQVVQVQTGAQGHMCVSLPLQAGRWLQIPLRPYTVGTCAYPRSSLASLDNGAPGHLHFLISRSVFFEFQPFSYKSLNPWVLNTFLVGLKMDTDQKQSSPMLDSHAEVTPPLLLPCGMTTRQWCSEPGEWS